jgi:predicted transcriptional regulator
MGAEIKGQAKLEAEIRLSLVVSPQLNATLEELAEMGHSTKSEILRKALALYYVAAKAGQDAKRLAIVDKDRNVLTDIVGI